MMERDRWLFDGYTNLVLENSRSPDGEMEL